jgi:hypothetical protein
MITAQVSQGCFSNTTHEARPDTSGAALEEETIKSNHDATDRDTRHPVHHSSSLSKALVHLLNLIKVSHFIRLDQLEPIINSKEGDSLLSSVYNLPGCPPISKRHDNRSIYSLLIDPLLKKCLICGKEKRSSVRAMSCVRGHLGHRPFTCGGEPTGCRICTDNTK